MKLSELLDVSLVIVNSKAKKREEILKELVGPLPLNEKAKSLLLRMLKEREKLGSTGIGKGIAIPHCRSLLLNQLMMTVGKTKKGIDFDAIDKKPVFLFFLIVAPPRDPGNQYLLTLGKIAQIAKIMKRDDKLFSINDPQAFLERLYEIERKIE